MGQEITHDHFTPADFDAFRARLSRETALLAQWFESDRFSRRAPVAGFELEAWLVDADLRPAPINAAFLERVADPLVVPELARFNVELNGHPQPLSGGALGLLERELNTLWDRCVRAAGTLDAHLLMIGILPTVRETQLSPHNMSDLRRYRALNEQVLSQREGRALELDIHGREHLHTRHRDVMLESAATSFQIHLKVTPEEAVRYYNVAQIVSAPMVAVSCNSPYLFEHDLWDETRIPLFEQAVAVGGYAGAAQGPLRRVSFGSGYARASVLECFRENEQHLPVLLPMLMDDPEEALQHLRLHNGTIWRWNRPLVGFDDDGTPHLRIEHRVVPGGPTVSDALANAAFFYGLAHSLATQETAPEQLLPFVQARDNFYAAARHGLDAQITWLDGRRGAIQALITEHLLPRARAGLTGLGIDPAERDHYLGIIAARAAHGCTGAAWQRAWVARHGRDMRALAAAYLARQQSGIPVHDWDI